MMQLNSMPSAWITPALIQDGGSPTGGGMLGVPSSGATQPSPSAGADGTANAPVGGNMNFMFLILLMFGAMILITGLSGRKDKKRRSQMLSALGKKDKVRTAGGIIGTVIEMKEDEVLLETDRASHTRMWLAKGSIASVIKHAKQDEQESAEPTAEASS